MATDTVKCFCGHPEWGGYHDEKLCVDTREGLRLITDHYGREDIMFVVMDEPSYSRYTFWLDKIKNFETEKTANIQLEELEKWLCIK